jgi:dethiobiotin synthetase
VGKTHAAAALMLRYPELLYWKAVQTGFPEDDDRALVKSLSSLPEERLLETGFTFREPLSPHRAAELERRELLVSDIVHRLQDLKPSAPVLCEGAGGVYVPLNRRGESWIDFLNALPMPVVVAASTGLGTINHSLLTLSSLRNEGHVCVGILFCGPENPDTVRTICELGQVRTLGRFNASDPGEMARIPERIDPDGLLSRHF